MVIGIDPRRSHRPDGVLTIAILILLHEKKRPAISAVPSSGAGPPEQKTYEEGEGLLVLGDLLFSQRVGLQRAMSATGNFVQMANETDLPRKVGGIRYDWVGRRKHTMMID